MIYLDHWGLKFMPFDQAPDPRFFFESDSHREAVTRLVFAAQSRKLMALLTGDYGVGKTMVCDTALGMLSPNLFKTAYIRNPRMDAIDLTREMVRQFGESVSSRSPYDVQIALNALLDRHAKTDRHTVVVIDEAQRVLDTTVLEDLRMLLNHQSGGKSLMTLILAGQTELGDLLKTTPQMMQRIALKYHVPNLSDEDVHAYVAHRMSVAGGTIEIFEQDAIRKIAALSKGNAREINALCDLCLLTGEIQGVDRIAVPLVEEAWKERE